MKIKGATLVEYALFTALLVGGIALAVLNFEDAAKLRLHTAREVSSAYQPADPNPTTP